MAEQQSLFDKTTVNMTQFQPHLGVQAGAAGYAKAQGRTYDPERALNARATGVVGHAVFQEHKAALARPMSPATSKSYDHLTREVNDQYDYMTRPKESGGLGIGVEVVDDNPYDDPKAMATDFAKTNQLRVLSTATTGGHAIWDDQTNDRFRAVHDVFGHLASGRGFSRDGEEGAYQSHAQMFSPEARGALAGETRGQNSYLNWGGGGFPENRGVTLPGWASDLDPIPPQKTRKIVPQGTQQSLGL